MGSKPTDPILAGFLKQWDAWVRSGSVSGLSVVETSLLEVYTQWLHTKGWFPVESRPVKEGDNAVE